MNKFELSLKTACAEVVKRKAENAELRFRVETCVHKRHVKVYVIQGEKILSVLTCMGTEVNEEIKIVMNKEEK